MPRKKQSVSPLVRIADDDDDVRESLAFMLECEGYEVASYATGRELLNDLAPDRPGCFLLDVRMPGLSGPEVQAKLIERGAAAPVIFLTAYADVEVAVKTMKRGAEDFLMKPVNPEKLIAAIKAALESSGGAAERASRLKDALSRLTERQRSVLRLMNQGLDDSAIAERLGLSIRTAQLYRGQIYKAIDVHSQKEFQQTMSLLSDS